MRVDGRTKAASTPADEAARALAFLNRARFVRSVTEAASLPEDAVAEVAFVGRSNAGKSSAINAIVNHKRLAFVSKQPGRTRELNYFALGAGRYLVDLPGYGYAAGARHLRQSWDRLIGHYLLQRAQLACVVLIMDIRHAPTELDLELLDFLRPARRTVHVLLTKADKLARGARINALRQIRHALGSQPSIASLQLFSNLNCEGVAPTRIALCEALQCAPTTTSRRETDAGTAEPERSARPPRSMRNKKPPAKGIKAGG